MAAIRPAIVVIEDDAKFRRLLRNSLQGEGYEVHEADGGRTGLAMAAARKPDLIVLDLGLPDIDGSEIIARVRQWWAGRPIIVLSGRAGDGDKIAALEAGADDYLVKPIAVQEFLARVRAALRRAARGVADADTTRLQAHGVHIDLLARRVTRGDAPVALTPNEFRVLAILARHAGRYVTTENFIKELWGPQGAANNRQYLRGYMASLRRKLEENPARPVLLETEAGVGYRLALDQPARADGIERIKIP